MRFFFKESIIEKIQNNHDFVLHTVNSLIEEHKFNEYLDEMLKKLQRDLIRTVCAVQYTIKGLSEQFAQFKEEAIKGCGSYRCFEVKQVLQFMKYNKISIT